MKRLYRSTTNRMFTGLFGGMGEYFSIDPIVLRAGYVLLTVFTGFIPGLIAYFVASAIVPTHSHTA